MDFTFMDSHLNQLYSTEQKLSYLINIFSFLAILLATMGLFSLVSFMVSHRLKEVCIRKVLGASVISTLVLLSSKYFRLISIASLISFPIVHLVLNRWLEDFAYHIEIGLWVYIISGVFLLLLTLIVINYHALKAALVNPAKILRSE